MRFPLSALSIAALGLWLIAPVGAQELAEGERLFRGRCASCHSLEPGQSRIAPNLTGVFDRAAGQVAGARYSEALRNAGLVWNAEQLDTFLENPRQVVPGTTMTYSLRDAAQRQAIIAYLRGLPRPKAGQ